MNVELLKKWIQNPDLINEKLEKLLTHDGKSINMVLKKYELKEFMEDYYYSKMMQLMAYMTAMPNVMAYGEFKESKETPELAYPNLYIVRMAYVPNDEDIDLSFEKGGRNCAEMILRYWGEDKYLKEMYEIINAQYKNEVMRRKAYLKFVKKLASDLNVHINKRKRSVSNAKAVKETSKTAPVSNSGKDAD